MRKIKRNIARTNMRNRGLRRINSKRGGRSFFATHWREYV